MRLVIGGVSSAVGKTTVSLLISSMLIEKGYEVQMFKVGPDYIDPSYHSINTGRSCRNLDSWMVPKKYLLEIINHASKGADILIIEGVMGLYDGLNGLNETGSTAEIAKLTKSPVILVMDVHDMARTSGAIVMGLIKFDKNVKIKGVILNNVVNDLHGKWCREIITKKTGIPVIGALPKINECKLPERHLGLIPTIEKKTIDILSKIKLLESYIDIYKIIEIAQMVEPIPTKISLYKKKDEKKIKIGVAFDEAFNFYYQENLELLSINGAEIITFSPLHDRNIPTVDALYLGGGFPEVYSEKLAANHNIKKQILGFAEEDNPIYAECGGLMYLTSSITSYDGIKYPMIGIFNSETIMSEKLTLNYTLAEVINDNFFSNIGEIIKGHEFHYSKILQPPSCIKYAYRMKVGVGIDGVHDGWIEKGVLGSYMHLNFCSNPRWVKKFLRSCCKK